MFWSALLLGLSAAMSSVTASSDVHVVNIDPPRDNAHPASMEVALIPSGDAAMNAILYRAAGAGPHPTLLLFHGFPGNEQNLDLAQAARRIGWNVLTLHYRGSWGSSGAFSFANCAEDTHAALGYLRSHADSLGVDKNHIAVAGHSMGGMMAARLAADDRTIVGAFLIDPWDIAYSGSLLTSPEIIDAVKKAELDADIPPLSGVTEDEIVEQMKSAGPSLDLAKTVSSLADRPLAVIYAEYGLGSAEHKRMEAAIRSSHPVDYRDEIWVTDHSFSDKRIALATALTEWLGSLTGEGHIDRAGRK